MKSPEEFLVSNAIRGLKKAGLDVKDKAYGFQINYSDQSGVYIGQCGVDNDGSVSISINTEERSLPTRWFFRYSMGEMADFLIASHNMAIESRKGWMSALLEVDAQYDHEHLSNRLKIGEEPVMFVETSPNRPLAKFLYPIVDSGYFFNFEWLEVIKETIPKHVLLKFRYSLQNNYSFPFQIPINITHRVYLNSTQEYDFVNDKSSRGYSDRVVDLQSNTTMYGYGDDHHVLFEPYETKEFLILFKPLGTEFATFDTEFFLKPDDDDYGLYRFRYDLQKKCVTKRFCARKYKADYR